MSIEADFLALLSSSAPLVALVGDRIAQDAVPEGDDYPLVVFTARHDIQNTLDGVRIGDQCSLSVQCWAQGSVVADEVADEVVAALSGAPASAGVLLLDRSATYEPDLALDGVVLTVQWWGT